MILTCSQCHARYDIDTALLGERGRDVRCVSCGHVWFQSSEKAEALLEVAEAVLEQPPEPVPAPEQPEPAPAPEEVKEEPPEPAPDIPFDALLSSMQEGGQAPPQPEPVKEKPAAPAPEEKPVPLSGGKDKKALARAEEPAAPPITHNPFGVGATAFGALLLLLLASATLGGVLLFKDRLIHRYPQAIAFYEMIGVTVAAPGEGLRIADLAVERRAELDGAVLAVTGRMMNETEKDIVYPALRAVLSDEKGRPVKTWNLKPGSEKIVAGDIVPLTLRLPDAPEGGASLEVLVTDGR